MNWSKLTTRIAAALVLLQALLFVLGLVRFTTWGAPPGYSTVDERGLPIPVVPLAVGAVLCFYAAPVLWRSRLFGEGIGVVNAAANLLAVGAVLLFAAFLVLGSTWSRVGTLDAVYLAGAAVVLVGCVQALLASWQDDDAGSMRSP